MKHNKLEAAIRAGDLEKVRELIADGTDVSAKMADGSTPIQLAARERQITILRALAGAGARLTDLETLNFEERLRLFVESSLDMRSDEDLMSVAELSEWAMQAAAEQVDEKFVAAVTSLEGTLLRAARTQDLELLKRGIADGEDVNQVSDITMDTPLTVAVQKRDEEMVRELIRAGADVNHAGFSTALSFVLPDLHLAKILLDAGADLYEHGLDYRSPLERAVERAVRPTSSEDSQLLVRFFLEAGVHPPDAESSEGTLLLDAEYAEAWELYHELLPHYPEATARTSIEELGFHQGMKHHEGGFMQWTFDIRHAACEGDLEALEELLAKPQDRETAKELGLALREAVAHMELDAARFLIEAGADLNAVKGYENERGSTPLACAAESWHRQSGQAVRLLLEAGADVNQRGHLGRTPLMYAVLLAHRHGAPGKKAVPALLEAGADPNLRDDFGLTAWTIAKAALIEEEERARAGDALARRGPVFGGPDLSELFSKTSVRNDDRQGRVKRCREALKLLEKAGGEPHGEAELRLMVAAAAGDAARVGELLAAGASADARGTDGLPAIVAAAQSGSHEAVQRLIDAGCKVDTFGGGHPLALEVAVRGTDLTMTRQLLDAGSNATSIMTANDNPLKAAEEAGATELVEMVRHSVPEPLAYLDRDVEEEIAAEERVFESQEELPTHAAFGDLEKVRELLANPGVEADGFDTFFRTALMAAAEAGQVEMVRELIARGADVNKSNGLIGCPRSTPLACAAICPSAERDRILKLLLNAGADADQLGADGRTALMHAVERDIGFFGRTGEFALSTRTLIDAGANLEIRDRYGLTAWARAMSLASAIDLEDVSEQYEEVAQVLEEAGARKDAWPDVDMLWALMVGETDHVMKSLSEGASPDARRHDGATALILAVRDGLEDVVVRLIEAGCDVNAREWIDRGPTALHAAELAESRKLCRILREAGALELPHKTEVPYRSS